MPSEGIELSPPEHILSDDEVIRLATLFVKSGVTKIRLTGGEPMVRKGIVDIVGTYAHFQRVAGRDAPPRASPDTVDSAPDQADCTGYGSTGCNPSG